MGRKIDVTEEPDLLSMLIEVYAANKEKAADLKVLCDEQNAKIKDTMLKRGLTTVRSENCVANYVVRQNRSVDEDKMVAILMELDADAERFQELGVIKTKYYIDSEVLENAIYQGYLDQEMLAKLDGCSTVKEVPTLVVKKRKKD